MRWTKFILVLVISLCLGTLALPPASRGQSLADLINKWNQFKQDAKKLNDKIIMVQNTVNSIYDDDVTGRITPEGAPEGPTPKERVRDLKQLIKQELGKAKGNYLALEIANEKLTEALNRYTKNATPENFKNAEGIVKQINNYRNALNNNFDVIKRMIKQISMTRSAENDTEWNKPDGKYKDERKAIDNLWNMLSGPDALAALTPKGGNWQETNLDTKKTRTIKLTWEGDTVKAIVGNQTYVSQAVSPGKLDLVHYVKSPEDIVVITNPVPRKVLEQAIATYDLTATYTLQVKSPTLMEGTYDGDFFVQWEGKTLKLRTFQREGPKRVQWRALSK